MGSDTVAEPSSEINPFAITMAVDLRPVPDNVRLLYVPSKFEGATVWSPPQYSTVPDPGVKIPRKLTSKEPSIFSKPPVKIILPQWVFLVCDNLPLFVLGEGTKG